MVKVKRLHKKPAQRSVNEDLLLGFHNIFTRRIWRNFTSTFIYRGKLFVKKDENFNLTLCIRNEKNDTSRSKGLLLNSISEIHFYDILKKNYNHLYLELCVRYGILFHEKTHGNNFPKSLPLRIKILNIDRICCSEEIYLNN